MAIKKFRDFGNVFKLVTSNKQKLGEYRKYMPNIESVIGDDIPEVLSDDMTVILYKSLHNGAGTLCEDTSLNVDGFDIGVNIRWLIDKIDQCIGSNASWKVLIGKNDGTYITIYEGMVEGVIGPKKMDGIAFDPYFYIDGKCLTELKADNSIDPLNYSARSIAANNIKNDTYIKKIRISDIPEWKGEYQH